LRIFFFSAAALLVILLLLLPFLWSRQKKEGDIFHRISREALEKPCTRYGRRCAQKERNHPFLPARTSELSRFLLSRTKRISNICPYYTTNCAICAQPAEFYKTKFQSAPRQGFSMPLLNIAARMENLTRKFSYKRHVVSHAEARRSGGCWMSSRPPATGA